MSPDLTRSKGTDAGRVRRTSIPRLLSFGVIFGTIWLTLAGHEDPSSWLIGLPAVVGATWAHARLSSEDASRLSVFGAIRLIRYFFHASFMGGIDVAWRVVGPRLDVAPGFFDYKLFLTLPSARVFFVDLVSLLPGTLSADVRGATMQIHALDCRVDPVPELDRLERRVAALFGETLPNRAVPAS